MEQDGNTSERWITMGNFLSVTGTFCIGIGTLMKDRIGKKNFFIAQDESLATSLDNQNVITGESGSNDYT